jgi:hypothetical protein
MITASASPNAIGDPTRCSVHRANRSKLIRFSSMTLRNIGTATHVPSAWPIFLPARRTSPARDRLAAQNSVVEQLVRGARAARRTSHLEMLGKADGLPSSCA